MKSQIQIHMKGNGFSALWKTSVFIEFILTNFLHNYICTVYKKYEGVYCFRWLHWGLFKHFRNRQVIICKKTKKEPRFFLVFHWRWKIGQWKKLLGVFLMLNLVDNTLHIIAEQGDKNAELGFLTFLFNMSHFVLPTRITVLLSRIITISYQALCNIIF